MRYIHHGITGIDSSGSKILSSYTFGPNCIRLTFVTHYVLLQYSGNGNLN